MIDARGYACPMPVVMVRNEIRKSAPAALSVLVDNQTAVENITRFAANNGYTAETAPEGRDFRITLNRK